MFKATKKVYMSILAILVVFITVVATTYAWVGILTYAQTDTFKLNLKTQKINSDYYLSISATGNDDDFGENADEVELKKQILTNMGYSFSPTSTNDQILALFNRYCKLNPVTATKNQILNDEFHALDFMSKRQTEAANSNSFYKFDVYLSIEHREGDLAITPDTNFETDLILAEISKSLEGEISDSKVANEFSYPSDALYNPNNFGTIKETDLLKIDVASATRLAFVIYDPIDRNSNYTSSDVPSNIMVYEGGTHCPSYDVDTDLYSFGGVLPDEYNLALFEHKVMYNIPSNVFNVPNDIKNRGDLELIESNRAFFDDDFGFGIKNGKKKKVKITVYFWFEGWDADCFSVIEGKSVRINLNFSAGSLIA